MGKIAILTIHGIGNQKKHYTQSFHIELLNKIRKDNKIKKEIKCFELEWQHLIQPREECLSNNLSNIKWKKTRNIALTFIGDVISYEKENFFYENIHKNIDEKLKEINDWLGEDGKLYIVSHSLGTVIIFDYIYNIQNNNSNGNKIFKATSQSINAIDKLEVLFTLGSPLYVYSLQKYLGGSPIKIKKWINIYSICDVIAYPVKTINQLYNNCDYIIDIPVVIGNLFTFWNPISHVNYFDSNKILSIIKNEVYKNYGTRN